MTFRLRLRSRLFLALFAISCGGIYFLLDWTLRDLRVRYLEAVEETLVETSSMLAAQIEAGGDPHAPDLVAIGQEQAAALRSLSHRDVEATIYRLRKTRIDLRIYATDARGTVVWDSDLPGDSGADYSRWRNVSRTLKGTYGARATRKEPDDPATSALHVTAPIRREGRIVGTVTVVKPSSAVEEFLSIARPKIVTAGIAVSVGLVVAGWLLSMWLLVPIQRLARHAQAVRDGKDPPLPDLGTSEVRELGLAFEEMRRALEGRQYVERYVHSLTHELKSPLTAMRAAAEILSDDPPPEIRERFLNHLREEVERQQRLIDRLLELASLENRATGSAMTEIDLSVLVRDVVDQLEPRARAKGVSVDFVPTARTVSGDRLLLEQAVGNLAGNALEFSPTGSRVRVCIAGDDPVRIVVEDGGPGIPDWALARVWERFFSMPRPDTGRKSTGLGLPFVREVARLHGGTAALENRPEGGCRATLVFPSRKSR